MVDESALRHLLAQVRRSRPWVADALRLHHRDLLTVVSPGVSDEARVAALLRAGEPTIGLALAESWPMGSGIEEQRLTADLTLLHAAWTLAIDDERPLEYRRRARATAHGIGLAIASGLSGMDVPGGLDIQIWRACGTRDYGGPCDDDLCRICLAHDHARAAINAQASRKNWETVLGVVGAGALVVGVVGVMSALFDDK